MDGFQFAASLTSSVAWPIAAVVIVFAFRTAIAARMPALSKLTLPGGLSAEFEKGITQAEAEADKLPSPQQKVEDPSEPVKTVSADLEVRYSVNADAPETLKVAQEVAQHGVLDHEAMKANPAGVVMENWKSLELTLRTILAMHWPTAKIGPISDLIRFLTSRGFLSAPDHTLLLNLTKLRNIAAHTEENITPENAERFAEVVNKVQSELLNRARDFDPKA